MEAFKKHGLSNELLNAISDMGFETPTPIQDKVIPAILQSNNDIIALAETGTGKTAGFGLPIIQKISTESKSVQAIILCPTRELCLQITKDLTTYTKYLSHLSVVPVYGGANISTQIKDLKKGAHIVVGTPGRTLDLINRKVLKINNINWLVLDEADEMLNMGFRPDLDSILGVTPSEKQTLLFSATMPKGVRQIAENYMNNPNEIVAGKRNTGAANISHEYYVVRASDRYLALKRLVDVNPNIYGLIFCRTRHETKEVADKLMQDGYNADALHGDLSQAQRDYVMQRFRIKNLQLLVATDVAARGIDVDNLTHVINYNLPDDPEVYIHRSGRTGRAGKLGTSLVIAHSRETRKIRDLEKLVGKEFSYQQVPTGNNICEKQLYNLIEKIEHINVDEEQIGPYLPQIYKKLEWLDREELLKRFVSVEFNRFLEYYRNAKDINIAIEKEGRGKRGTSNKTKYSRLFINVGTKQKLNATGLISLLNEQTNSNSIEIGKIDLLKNFSFFEVDKSFENEVIDAFKGAVFSNTELNVQVSKPDSSQKNGRENNSRDRKRNSYSDRKPRNRKKSRSRSRY